MGRKIDPDGDLALDLCRISDASFLDRGTESRGLFRGCAGYYRFSRHPIDPHVGLLVAHLASAPIDPATGQSAMGQYSPGYARCARHQFRRICAAVLLPVVPSFPPRRTEGRNQGALARQEQLMGAWGFVFLAYGIVWGAILIYWLTLKRRLERAEAELARLRPFEESRKDDQT